MKRILYSWANALIYVQFNVSRFHIPHNPLGARFIFLPLGESPLFKRLSMEKQK